MSINIYTPRLPPYSSSQTITRNHLTCSCLLENMPTWALVIHMVSSKTHLGRCGKINLSKSCFAFDLKGLRYGISFVGYKRKGKDLAKRTEGWDQSTNLWESLRNTSLHFRAPGSALRTRQIRPGCQLREEATEDEDGILNVLIEWLNLLKQEEFFLFIQSQSKLMYIFEFWKCLFAIHFECGD